jgi:sulfur carrier protein ThiS
MKVTVRLYAELARRVAGGQRQIEAELPAGSSVQDLLTQLAVPDEPAVIVGRNGSLANGSDPLVDGDRIELMTQMEGG